MVVTTLSCYTKWNRKTIVVPKCIGTQQLKTCGVEPISWKHHRKMKTNKQIIYAEENKS